MAEPDISGAEQRFRDAGLGGDVKHDVAPGAGASDSGRVREIAAEDLYARLGQIRIHAAGEPAAVVFSTQAAMQQWRAMGVVDFLELFCGWQQLTERVMMAKIPAGDGLDRGVVSYGLGEVPYGLGEVPYGLGEVPKP